MKVRSTLAGNPSADSLSIKATGRYCIEEITTEAGLARLEEDWNRLSETAEQPNVFMTYDWFRAWNRRFTQDNPDGQRPNVLVLKKDGAVAGISPLIRRKVSHFGFGGRKLEFVAREADYNDLALGKDAAGQAEAIVDYLAQTQDQWDLIDLRDLRETGNVMALIETALSHARLKYRILPEEERCPYLLIDAPWPAMVSRFSHSAPRAGMGLRTLRMKQHRIERLGAEGLRVRVIENPQDEPTLLEKLIALESQKHVDGEPSPPFVGKYPEVFQLLFDTLGPRGWVYVALMELGDRPVAWLMGFRCGKKLWYYQGAYDRSFSRLSPGTMLFLTVLDYGFLHGYKEYDFLRDEEPYKLQWSTGVHQSYWLRIWSKNWISRAHALVYLDLKPAVKRLLGRAN